MAMASPRVNVASAATKVDQPASLPLVERSGHGDWARILLVTLVAICLALPAFLQIAGLSKLASENRVLAAWPGWPTNLADLRKFPEKVTAFVNDRFGLRSQLVRWNSELRLKLGTSSSPSVAVGKDGFLFYAYHEERLLEQHTGEDVYTPDQLEHWLNSVLAERDWLKARGIAFYVLIAPDKSTIYPELLPNYPQMPGTTTRLDQVVARLKTVQDLEFIDPRQALWRAKQTWRVYDRADSHWNPRGAFVAYDQLMARVVQRFPDANAVTLSDYQSSILPVGGDLGYLLNLSSVLLYPEERLQWKGRTHLISTEQRSEVPYSGWPAKFMHTDLNARPRLVVFGDSFTDYVLGPLFLYETFRDPVYIHHNGPVLDHHLIEMAHPDLVILELAER